MPTTATIRGIEMAKTLFLFTSSDIITFVCPQTIFGIAGASSGPLLTSSHNPDPLKILQRAPLIGAWIWLNTLIFDLSNQRLSGALLEDRLNKPWRPLPAGRISSEQTRRLLFVTIPFAMAIIYWKLGAIEEALLLLPLTWMYNDLGGSDENFVCRDFLIAIAYSLYGRGALKVACAYPTVELNAESTKWLCICAVIIFTTMHVQDLKDMPGDRARGRSTAPLVMGETASRLLLAIAVTTWSLLCSLYWRLSWWTCVGVLAIGSCVGSRAMLVQGVTADRMTWRLWAGWIILVYLLPWLKFSTSWH